jgi:hypothetical protein
LEIVLEEEERINHYMLKPLLLTFVTIWIESTYLLYPTAQLPTCLFVLLLFLVTYFRIKVRKYTQHFDPFQIFWGGGWQVQSVVELRSTKILWHLFTSHIRKQAV